MNLKTACLVVAALILQVVAAGDGLETERWQAAIDAASAKGEENSHLLPAKAETPRMKVMKAAWAKNAE